MIIYKLVTMQTTQGSVPVDAVFKISDDQTWMIPFDPANTDYQEYLAWLAEGNEPLPAEE